MSERLSKHGNQVAEYILNVEAELRDFGWEELAGLAQSGDLSYLMEINQLVWGSGELDSVEDGGGVSGVTREERLSENEIVELFHKDIGM